MKGLIGFILVLTWIPIWVAIEENIAIGVVVAVIEVAFCTGVYLIGKSMEAKDEKSTKEV